MRWLPTMALAASLAACAGGDGGTWGEPLTVGEDRRLEGRVVEVDPTPMFVDGDGEITLRTDDHGVVLIRIPSRERVCEATGLDVFSSVTPGDSMRVMGQVTRPREVTVCVRETHFLENVDSTTLEGGP